MAIARAATVLFTTAVAALAQAPAPALPAAPSPPTAAAERPLRLGVVQWLRTNREEEDLLVPPVYSNHLPKSLTYETLVVVDDRGQPRPGLASHWEVGDGGKRYTFHLRPAATFHDGSPCDAAAVKRYFESWLVRDLDRFVGLCERIARIDAVDRTTLVFHLREPYAALCDLALMNPMGVVGGAVARGMPYPQIGTGPWRVVECEPMRRMRFARHERYDGPRPQLDGFEWITLVAGADRDPVSTWAFERGHVDAVVESWRPSIPRDLALELVAKGSARLVQGNGSMVQILCFHHERGPFAELASRRVVRDAVDRAALVRVVEHGLARPCTTVFAPEIADWPDAGAGADPATATATARAAAARTMAAVAIAVSTDPAQMVLLVELARQLRPHGIDLRIDHVTPTEHARRVRAGEYDLYVSRTWGTPYDPQATLYSRFRAETSQQRQVFFANPELVRLVDEAALLDPGPARAAVYQRVQDLLDRHVAVLPLYVPDRIALLGPHVDGLALGSVIYGIDLSGLRRRDAAGHR